VNIVYLCLDYPSEHGGSGVGSQTQSLAHGLREQGHRITVVALATQNQVELFDDNGVAVIRVRPGNLHWYVSKLPLLGNILALPVRELEYSAACFRALRRVQRSHCVDIAECTETGGLLVARFGGVPLVVRLHGDRYTFDSHTPHVRVSIGLRLSRVLQRYAMRRARRLVAPSKAHAAEIGRELAGCHPSISIIPNTLRPNIVHATSLTRTSSRNDDAPVILYVGRLDAVKGIDVLLRAAEIVLRSIPRARVVLVGGSHPSLPVTALRRMILAHNLEHAVTLTGHIPTVGLEGWYRRATVFAFPSFYETFGIALLEAQAYGLAVIAANTGGLPEIVRDGITGILVPPGDASALATALIRLLRDPLLREQLGRAAQSHAFSAVHQCALNASVDLYHQVCERAAACSGG
jgi:glycogen synthase